MITSDLDYHMNFVDKAAVPWQSLSKLYLSNLVIYILSLDIMPFVKSSLIHRHASSINHQDPVLKRSIRWFPLLDFPGGSVVKNRLQCKSHSLGQEDLLEEKMATHSSTLGEIPQTEDPGGLQSVGLQKSQIQLSG